MIDQKGYDVIIIGTGAGGGTLGYALASAGLKILLLERGPFLHREKENWDPSALFIQNRYTTQELWSDKEGNKFRPGTHYFVGGNTKFFGAALLRLREKDFSEVRHKDGISPAWPLSYRDFQPYYLQAERLYSVHGQRKTDPLEPPETAPYPCPPLSHETEIQNIYDKLKGEGYHPFPLPIGIRLNEEARQHSQCIRCDTCDGYPCLVDAKSDAHTTCVNPALTYPKVTLLTEAKVTRLISDSKAKKVTQVEAEIQGNKMLFSGDIVVVSCGAINSSTLLLRSGLANSSGMVGRHYMCHNNSAIVAVSRRPNPTLFQKTIGINDFYYGAPDWNYPLGHIQLLGKVKKEMILADLPKFIPDFPIEYLADHSVGWWITTEDLPDKNNRVTLDKNGDIVLSYTPNNQESHKKLYEKLKEILKVVDFDQHIFRNDVYFRKQVPIAGVAHQVGTCRFGKNAKESVLDLNCKTHDLDNLYVVDGSFFPCSSSVNPGLTIMANALRISDHLCERFNVKRKEDLRCRLESFYKLP